MKMQWKIGNVEIPNPFVLAPMAGVPFHAADGYINRLVKKGYKVAICEDRKSVV